MTDNTTTDAATEAADLLRLIHSKQDFTDYKKLRDNIPTELLDDVTFWLGDHLLCEMDRDAGWGTESHEQ